MPVSKGLPSQAVWSDLAPSQTKSAGYARRIYNDGTRQIFKAPSHISFLTQSYILGTGGLVGAIALSYTDHWNTEYNRELGLHWFVGVVYRIVIPLMGCLGLLAFYQTTRFVGRINLVQLEGTTKAVVTIRRGIPFLKAQKIVTEPYNITMSELAARDLELVARESALTEAVSGTLVTRLGNVISQAFYIPFAATRKVFTHYGVVWIHIKDQDKTSKYRLDLMGSLSNKGQDMLNVATIRDDL